MPPTITAPAHCPFVNGPCRIGSGAGARCSDAYLPGNTVCSNGSGVLTSTLVATAVDAAEPLTEPVEVCGASEASTAEPVEGVGTATAVIPGGGHGSPPGVRGRPRRRDSPPDAASPTPEPVEGLGASTASSVASLSRSTTCTESAAAAGEA